MSCRAQAWVVRDKPDASDEGPRGRAHAQQRRSGHGVRQRGVWPSFGHPISEMDTLVLPEIRYKYYYMTLDISSWTPCL